MYSVKDSTIKLGLIGLLLILSLSCHARADIWERMHRESDAQSSKFEKLVRDNAVISDTSIHEPINRILLVRQGPYLCGIRFTEAHRAHDATRGNIFFSGAENFYGKYDWYYQNNGTGRLDTPNVSSGHRKLHMGPSYGIGRFILWGGGDDVECGSFKFYWLYPTGLSMLPVKAPQPTRMADTWKGYDPKTAVKIWFAPTAEKNVKNITLDDLKIEWFTNGQGSKRGPIPLDDLP